MIDLRSDTVTRPTQAMRDAMANAPVGDDVYGDDPTVNALQERVAALFGKEAGLFTPTGSLSNQLAIRTLVKHGDELLTETQSHIVRAELGAGAVFSGITTRTWPSKNGILRAHEPLEIASPDAGPYLVSTTAIAVENTHNFGGGTVQSIHEIAELRKQSQALGLTMHLDGARIWNAHVATGTTFQEFGSHFDTVSVCFSKGLGAPVGSMMLSTQERILEATRWRKRYGAGMRQIGILAAGVDYALTHNIARLAEDHRRAQVIAEACAAVSAELIDPALAQTNIVAIDVSRTRHSAGELVAQLKEEGILAGAMGSKLLRFVTHMDFDDAQLEKVVKTLPSLLKNALVAK
jgi:threonine aldolase